ncbi:caspase family protein [Halegenticoccus tardaugens]|uniref:caspase family protein n=1 Tax=Halegenticoccus tardaugens TaxID=2071624 RepID=UPI00100B6468|nr:caspase family protein [Halegenticoccus tardaugens]
MTSDDATFAAVRFEALSDRPGIRLVDDIENARFEVYAADPIDPTETPSDDFLFPIDLAVSFSTATLTIPKLSTVVVRDADGRTVSQSSNREEVALEPGSYCVEITTAPVKLYVAVESSVAVRYDDGRTVLAFAGPTPVTIGARSFHEKPAGTVTTPADPESLMDAVSLLGSALQTTSPERSFPTLRGHPPLFELGDRFEVPDRVRPPDTGVEIVLPRRRDAVFASASLAYYLGAAVVPGTEPRLRGDGWQHPLADGVDLETGIGRALRQAFFLDCLARTEGYYPVDLHERSVVERAFDLDFPALYELALDERLGEYFSVPFDDLEPHLPEWSLTTDVRPTPENVEMLPFLANDLSLIRCPSEAAEPPKPEPQAVTDFLRDGPAAAAAGDFLRSEGEAARIDPDSIVQPRSTETMEHAWVGDGYPLGTSKATPESYRRRLTRDVTERTSIEITIVCNDEEMRDEGVVADLYGQRDLLQFDVEIHHDLSVAEMEALLREPTNFLHYIGHVDDDGIKCSDGFLDVRSMEGEVAVESFLLNACRSYQQGHALIERGSYGGVVTLVEVANLPATKLGQLLARLLNCGFSLRSAMSVAKEEVLVGHQYMVLGDGGTVLCQSESGVPAVVHVSTDEENEQHSVHIRYYPSQHFGIGSLMIPYINDSSVYYIGTGDTEEFEISTEQLIEFLDLEILPLKIKNSLYWSNEVCKDDFV